MTESTESTKRQEAVDAERVAEIRRLLEQPGGQDEVSKRFGKSALSSDEYKVAQRQRQEAQARRREAAEARQREASRDRANTARRAQRSVGGAQSVAEVRELARQGQKDLRSAQRRAAAEQSKDRVQSQSRVM
ncbi:hypothetical protein [Tsukamurella paurometabola]|uniref:Uncharacterized protein n=1 Tax=Tsukamurella paurometabola TaxID=2061 RepID=A0ABS5NGW0_TSUPA|nr:hypothetical protein [Tsukamurella paurometabola]MBS4103092.1 hypothetical protein [Tsukamurella paurometabola]